MPIRTFRHHTMTVEVDPSGQVLSLSLPVEWETRGWSDGEDETFEAELYPTLVTLPDTGSFLSASVVTAKAKQFDDGFYAAVEFLVQEGSDQFPSKRNFLADLERSLAGFRNSSREDFARFRRCGALVAAARELGTGEQSSDTSLHGEIQDLLHDFRSNPLRSKPIGFYTWSEALSRIFRQDRLLQTTLEDPEETEPFRQALNQDQKLQQDYLAFLDLMQTLTNPFPGSYRDLASRVDTGMNLTHSLFPPSRSHETELMSALYKYRKIPDDFDLMEEIIRVIRSGKLNLAPRDDSGWYDHQAYALESLVIPENMPEAKHLFFCDDYREELLKLFKSTLALTRETHIKQLEVPLEALGVPFEADEDYIPPIIITPELTVEPLVTYYSRRARSYGFVRSHLERFFGRATLDDVARLTASGSVGSSLFEELQEMEQLFEGLYRITASEIGMECEGNGDTEAGFARSWIRSVHRDPDVGSDNRMMVPVFYDVQRGKTKVWAMLGYTCRNLIISFKKTPHVTVRNPAGEIVSPEIQFTSTAETLAYPVSAEFYTDRILNRDEFRSICDKHRTASEIIRAVSSSG